MKSPSRSLLIGILLGIATGAGGGYVLFRPASSRPARAMPDSASETDRLRADLDAARTELETARTTIERLRDQRERLLAGGADPQPGQATAAAPQPAPATAAEPPDSGERPRDDQRGNWWQQLERLRETDPDRYAEIQERIQHTRQAYADYRANQYAVLDARMQTALTGEESQLYQDIKGRLQTIDQLVEQIQDPGADVPRREIFEKMRQTQEELREFGQVDRQYQLMSVADRLGVRDLSAAEQFAGEIDRIYQETESYSSWRGIGEAARAGFMGFFGGGGQRQPPQ